MKKLKILFIAIFFLFLPASVLAAEASLFFVSGSGVYPINKEINVRFMVSSGGGQGINAVGAVLKYDTKFIKIKKITKEKTIFQHWPIEPVENQQGVITVAGGTPNPFKGRAGTIINLTLLPVKYGKTYINFDFNNNKSSTTVLSADGLGTNVLKDTKKAVYLIGTSAEIQSALTLRKKLSGRILIEVEKKGEAWYVYPDDLKRYYLGRPTDAFAIMRQLGLGAKNSYIKTYLNKKFPRAVWGKILIDVEDFGKAYYINPADQRGYYLGRPNDAFRIMRELGLGITNNDIERIPNWVVEI